MESDDKKVFVYDILPRLGPNEVYFLSASARNKYLSPQEREYYSLGRTEMILRTVAYSREDFFVKLERIQQQLTAYKTRNGLAVPEKCTVLYANINPCNTLKAYFAFQREVNKRIHETLHAQCQDDYFTRLDRRFLTEIQKASGTRHFIDVDIDIPDLDVLHEFISELKDNDVKFRVIRTRSGYHVLLHKDTVNYNFYSTLRRLNEANSGRGEIAINKNAMIPIPGTLQAGQKVKVV